MTINKMLRLERNLAVLDAETTGLNCKIDRICQLGITMHYPHREPIAWCSLINPGIPILNTKNHHITDDMVADKPRFIDYAHSLAPRLLDADICGYNVNFDIGFLREEFERAGVPWNWKNFIIDPMHIYRLKFGHNLTNAFKHYVNPNGFEGAHDAGADVWATEQVLMGQLSQHQDLPRIVKDLAAFCFPKDENAVDEDGKFIWVGKEIAINFGKHRGKMLRNLERNYLTWIVNNEFSDEIKLICRKALAGVYITKEEDANSGSNTV